MMPSGSEARAVLSRAALTLLAVLLFTRFGGLFTLPPSDISAFWPANALLFAGVFPMPGRPARLTLLLALPAYLAAELWIGYPLANAAIYSLANVSEVAVLIALLRAGQITELAFDRLRTLYLFLALALLASLCGGGLGSLPTAWEGGHSSTVLLRWSLADFFGYCLFAPLLLTLGGARPFSSATGQGGVAEAAGLAAALLATQALSFGVLGHAVSSGAQFLSLPILLWAALRFGTPGGAIATVIVACVAFFSAAHGVGTFAIGSAEENLASLQLFFASLVVSVLTIASLNAERRHSLDALQLEVAERRKAEEAMRQSETRYRSLFEDSPVSIWEEDFSRVKAVFDALRQAGVTDLEAHFDRHPEVIRQCAELARVVDVNRATLVLHGAKDRAELMAGLVHTFTPESFAAFRYELVNLWNGHTYLARDAVVKTLAGEPRQVTVYFAVCPGYETTLAKVFVSLVDITERKAAEAALVASERWYRSLTENLPDNLIRYDRQGRATYLNPALEKFLGVRAAERIGKTVREFHGDANYEAYAQAIEAVLATGEDREIEFTSANQGDPPSEFLIRMIAERDDQGALAGVLAISRDVTQQKRAERERQAHTERLAALERINRAIQKSGDLETMLGNVLDQILDIFVCDRAFLMYPCDPAAKSWSVPMERTRPEYPGAGVMGAEIPMDPEVAATLGLLLATQGAVKFGPGTERALPEDISARYGFKSFISMALYPRVGKAWQFGLHQCSHGRVWTAAEEELLLEIGRKLTDGLTGLLVLRELHDSERRLVEAQRLAHLGNWELDLIEGTLVWSDEIFRIFEIDKEKFGASYEAFLEAIHPDDRDRVNQAYTESLENKQAYDIVHRLRMRDGRIKFVREMCQTVYDAAGKPLRSVGTIQDITEQKLKEEELARYRDHLEEEVRQRTSELRQQQAFSSAVLENISDGIVACDGQGTLSFFNRATRLIHGIEQEDLPPDRWAERYQLLEEDGVTPMATDRIPLLRAFRGEQVREQPLIVVHADGSRHFLLCSGQPMLSETGEKLGAVISMHDVTLQKRAEAELIMARDAAEAANRAKSLFLANMSHELRTPLNAILGFSSLLHRDPGLAEAQRQNVDIINRSGEYLLALINDVLEIAKIESGKLRLEAVPFDLGGLVRDVAEMMGLRARQKGLFLELDQSSEFPRYIKGDEARLRQILVNLVGNAVKFTERGGVTLRLAVKDNHRHHLLIDVEDTGPGIGPEDRRRLFQPFQQLAEGVKQGGTGLGLAIARQFAQMMGGDISVDSQFGRGARFRVDLPLELISADELRQLGEAPHGEVVGLAPGQPAWRILIAEDQYENRMLLQHLMTGLGLQTRTAENGEECLRIFREWQPHLIWMDRRMPVMDGIEATRRIRRLPGGDQVKIVAVTASVFKEQQPEMDEAGMDGLVRKPYRASDIYDCMARQLGIRFIYHDAPTDSRQAPAPLSAQSLAALPADLRHEFGAALEILDSQRINELIGQIAIIDPPLGASLRGLAEYFDYPAILRALGEAK